MSHAIAMTLIGGVSMKGKMLKKIEIAGYRSICNAAVDLGNINILIGANGAGKSNFISVFALIQKIISLDLQSTVSKCGATSLLYNGPKETDKISIEASFDDNGYGFSLKLTDDERMFFSDEYYYWDPKDSKRVKSSLGTGHFESKWKNGVGNKIDYYVKSVLSAESWRVYHFNDTSRTSFMKRPCDVHNNLFLTQDARNIAPFLLRLKEEYPSDYENIVSTIRMVAPFFKDFVLAPNNNTDEVVLRWMKVGYDDVMGPNQLSDGTLRFICLTTLLLQPDDLRPMTIILDEPELGLFPQAMVYLAEMIRSVGQTSQLIISTQSADLVDEFSPEDIIVVKDNGAGTEFSRLEADKLRSWLEEDYTLGLLWKKNLLTGDY